MAKIEIIDMERKKVAEMEVDDRLLKAKEKSHLIYDVVRWQLAGKRSGTAATKERSAVSGGGKKPWKQKGTGRARAGHSRSPLWRGGGTIFGPRPRDYSYALPRKVREAGLISALSSKYQEERLVVLDRFRLEGIRTRPFQEALKKLGISSALIVIDEADEVLERSARNVPGVQVLQVRGLNVHDILRHEHLVFLRSSLEKVERNIMS
jgi:large subunit ribosomal protein L4